MLSLLQKLLKGGGLILLGVIVGVFGTSSLNHPTQVLPQQVIYSPIPTTSDIQGVATQAPIIASPSASLEPIQTPKPTPTPKPTKKPTIAPTPKQVVTPTKEPSIPTSLQTFTCNCSKTCTQISSCGEAQYQLKTCGCSVRDADGDGVACDGAPLNCQQL